MKIIKFVATRCQILRLKCTKFDFGWGSAPDPAGGAYSAPPDPLAGIKKAYVYGRGRGKKEEGGRRGRERKAEREGRKAPPTSKSWLCHCDSVTERRWYSCSKIQHTR